MFATPTDAHAQRITQGSAKPVRVDGDAKFTDIAAGSLFTCGVRSDRRVMCWGNNEDWITRPSERFQAVPTPTLIDTPVEFTSVFAGDKHVCALTADGHAYCWGHNEHGQLGD